MALESYGARLEREARDAKNALKSKLASLSREAGDYKGLHQASILKDLERFEQRAYALGYKDGFDDGCIATGDGLC